jgi:dTDP-4-dehydrorhamnose reductase
MKILLSGAHGQLGCALAPALAALGEVCALGRAEFDLAQPQRLAEQLDRLQPELIVNAAAYTAVDKAEAEPELAHAVNAAAPAALAAWAAPHGVPLLHYSTDYVFDGGGERPWRESDPTGPLNVYGASKLAGEQAVLARHPQALVLRTSWVFGPAGGNFLKTMLRLAGERAELKVVADQFGAPTSTLLLAETTVALLRQLLAGKPAWGLYHLAAAGATSWHGYVCELIRQATALGWQLSATPERVLPMAGADWPGAARRPANSRLDCHKLESTFGLTLPSWQQGVGEVLQAIKKGEHEQA